VGWQRRRRSRAEVAASEPNPAFGEPSVLLLLLLLLLLVPSRRGTT
jgi:hypothetical protein